MEVGEPCCDSGVESSPSSLEKRLIGWLVIQSVVPGAGIQERA
jgi:hypothetical protein